MQIQLHSEDIKIPFYWVNLACFRWPSGCNFNSSYSNILGSAVVECLTRDEGPRVRASLASLRCGHSARLNFPSLVLVQPRMTRPCLTERLLMGCKEWNQTKTVTFLQNLISVDSYTKNFSIQTTVKPVLRGHSKRPSGSNFDSS